jgi:hypothetical protein
VITKIREGKGEINRINREEDMKEAKIGEDMRMKMIMGEDFMCVCILKGVSRSRRGLTLHYSLVWCQIHFPYYFHYISGSLNTLHLSLPLSLLLSLLLKWI